MKIPYTLQEHSAKRLVPKEVIEQVSVKANLSQESIQKLSEAAQSGKRKLLVQMEAIHVGRTKNFTFYTKEGLSGGLESWTHPRQKPVLTHHNDMFGEPIGRIIKAEFQDVTQSGKAGLMFTCEITDPDAVEKVLDGRYQTVSIGATTDKVTCNICGTDRTTEWCDHWPGDEYEGQTAHFIIGTTFGREVSYVNVPADEFAGNTSVKLADDQPASAASHESVHAEIFQIAEGLFQSIKHPETNMFGSLSESMRNQIKSLLTFEQEGSEVPMKSEPEPVNNEQTPNTPVAEGDQTPPVTPETPATPATPEVPVTEGEQTPPATPASTEAPVEEGQKPTAAVPTTPVAPVVPVAESASTSQMQTTITNLVVENQTVRTQLSEMTIEKTRLLNENTDLHSKLHRILAEKVVDAKRQLNKPDVVGVEHEESVNAHVTRSKESLDNTLADLLAEAKNPRGIAGSVANPGYSGDESEAGQEKKISMSEADEIMKNMFSPKGKNKQ